MKRIVAIVLCLAMILSFTACAKAPETEKDNEGSLKVDEGLLNVTITIPADFYDEEDTPESIKADFEEKGIKKCTVNEDGSVTVVMTKAKRNEMLKEMKTDFEESMKETMAEDPSIVKFEYDDNFTEFKIYLNKTELDLSESFMVFAYFLVGEYYQIFDGKNVDDIDVRVIYINDSTGEEIGNISLSEMAESE